MDGEQGWHVLVAHGRGVQAGLVRIGVAAVCFFSVTLSDACATVAPAPRAAAWLSA